MNASQPLCITKVSNRLFIQISNTKHIGKDLRISLFNTLGRNVYTTKMKIMAKKFNLPIPGFLRGVYHAKIMSGKCSGYYGSFAITQ